MNRSLALLEIPNLTPTLVVLDRCVKSAGVELVGVESSMEAGQVIKLIGPTADVQAAGQAGAALARQMGSQATVVILPAPDSGVQVLTTQPPEYVPMLDIMDQRIKRTRDSGKSSMREATMDAPDALGLLETQGLVAALHATDTMLKTSAVSLVGKEKIGGAYVTIVIRGDVAAVQAAIAAGRETVEKLGGRLIMADVITRPHPELLALLPKLEPAR